MLNRPATDPCSAPPPTVQGPALTVLYDGSCPLCRREIGLYRNLPARTPLVFEDVSQPGCELPSGRTRSELLARFHVRSADGHLLSGAEAFLALWHTLPGWHWLARLGRLPGMPALLELAYRGFLRLRPRLQGWAQRFLS